MRKILRDRTGKAIVPVTGADSVYLPDGRVMVSYNANGFLISPFRMKAVALRYIGFREVKDDTTAYLLTFTRCLKFDFETFEVFWDVQIPGTTGAWHQANESLRVIDDEVWVVTAQWAKDYTLLTRLSDADGSVIEQRHLPINPEYGFGDVTQVGEMMLTREAVFGWDVPKRRILRYDMSTMEVTDMGEESEDNHNTATQKMLRLTITDEDNTLSDAMCTVINKGTGILVTREDGRQTVIRMNGSYNMQTYMGCIYSVNLNTRKILMTNGYHCLKGTMAQTGDNKYEVELSAYPSNIFHAPDREMYRNNKVWSPRRSKLNGSLGDNAYYRPIMNTIYGGVFPSYKNFILIAADIIDRSSGQAVTDIYIMDFND